MSLPIQRMAAILFGFLLLAALPAAGASMTWTAPDGVVYVLSARGDATCTRTPDGAECVGADGSAYVLVGQGCGPVTGAAECRILFAGADEDQDDEAEAKEGSAAAKKARELVTTSSLRCGETVYELSTGTPSGRCTDPRDGRLECTDGPSSASASCARGCEETTGAGSCRSHPAH